METTNTTKAVTELADDLELARKVASAIKTKDKAALLALVPEVVKEAKEDYAAVTAALPEIKAGYKTTEFWLTAGLLGVNAAYAVIKGAPLPFDVNGVLAALIGVYAVIRGLVKR